MESRFPLLMAVVVGAVLGAAWYLSPSRVATPRFRGAVPFGDTLRFRRCASDDECVAVSNGCCDCHNGSETIAVRQDMATKFRRSISCTGICTERSGPPCFEGVAVCVSERCEFQSAHGDRPHTSVRLGEIYVSTSVRTAVEPAPRDPAPWRR